MLSSSALSQIERKIGYTFRDKSLLTTCFTHSSYANRCGGESNERLEFLGDAVLGFLVAEQLYRRGGSEGEMTSARIRLVSAKPLEESVRAMGLEQYLLSAGTAGEKSVSSLFEALTAGIYLDGGMEAARAFVSRHLPSSAEPNYKGDLQEFLQGRRLETAKYAVVGRSGEDHAPHFVVEAAGGGERAFGEGSSVRAAEKQAAKALLQILNEKTGRE